MLVRLSGCGFKTKIIAPILIFLIDGTEKYAKILIDKIMLFVNEFFEALLHKKTN